MILAMIVIVLVPRRRRRTNDNTAIWQKIIGQALDSAYNRGLRDASAGFSPVEEVITEIALPTGDDDLESRRQAMTLDAIMAERSRRRRQAIKDIADADPESVENVLRVWLEDEKPA